MLVRIFRRYYSDKMQESITAIINSCMACWNMKYDRRPIKPVLQLTQTQNAPFQEIFIDLFSIEGKNYLTLIDVFSKLGLVIEVYKKITVNLASLKYFSYYDIPKKISFDLNLIMN